MQKRRAFVLIFAFVAAIGCSDSKFRDPLNVGGEPGSPDHATGTGGALGNAGHTATLDAGAGTAATGATSDALRVRVADKAGLTIEIITLACAGDCADVEAVAAGGNTPYAFAWDDGSTDPKRHVCLDASAGLTVAVTDTAVDADEFRYDAQTARADVTATVLDCSDGGVPDMGLCIENGSIEGTPLVDAASVVAFDAPPWNGCESSNPDIPGWASTPDLVGPDSMFGPGASDGATYAHLGWGNPLHEFISQALCRPMRAGASYSFLVDLASRDDSEPGQLEVYGSANECSREELLWTSPVLGGAWTSLCVTLKPTRDAGYITLNPTGPVDGMSFILVDNIVPVAKCEGTESQPQ